MAGQHYLVMSEDTKQRAESLDNGQMTEIVFFFCKVLLAEHGQIKDDVVLDHIEHVFFEPKSIAFGNQFQSLSRVYLYSFAFAGE